MAKAESVQKIKVELSKPEEVDQFVQKYNIQTFEPEELKHLVRYKGYVDFGEDTHAMPATYWNALQVMATRKGISIGEYLFDILVNEVQNNVDADLKKECGVSEMTREDKEYFIEQLREDPELQIFSRFGGYIWDEGNCEFDLTVKDC